jgi:hypothetical protein
MTVEDYQKKADYLRSIGQTALADDFEQLITTLKEAAKEIMRLREIERLYSDHKKWLDWDEDLE